MEEASRLTFLVVNRDGGEAASPAAAAAASEQQPSKRRQSGRAARRRRRKLKEIQRVEQELLLLGGTAQGTGNSGNAAAATTSADGTATPAKNNNDCALPADRSRVRPAVARRRADLAWNPAADGRALRRQLGYVPGNAIRVAARGSDLPVALRQRLFSITGHGDDDADADDDEPVVAHLYPIVVRDEHDGGKVGRRGFKARKRTRGATNCILEEEQQIEAEAKEETRNSGNPQQIIEPFPTSYWLTHPLLRNWVSQLEVEGFGRRLEERLLSSFDEDDSILHRMRAAHESYGRERWATLTEADRQLVRERGWTAALQTGVAGNHYQKKGGRAALAVKCLHAHAAHRLAGHDNLLGQWVLDELVERHQRQPPPPTSAVSQEDKMQM